MFILYMSLDPELVQRFGGMIFLGMKVEELFYLNKFKQLLQNIYVNSDFRSRVGGTHAGG